MRGAACLDHFPWRNCNITHQSSEDENFVPGDLIALEFSSEWHNLLGKAQPFSIYIYPFSHSKLSSKDQAMQLLTSVPSLNKHHIIYNPDKLQFNQGCTKWNFCFLLDHWMDIIKFKLFHSVCVYGYSVDVIKFFVLCMNSKVYSLWVLFLEVLELLSCLFPIMEWNAIWFF